MKRMKVIPADGMVIPLPDGNGNLPAEGKVLTLNTYWYRREADRDVRFEPVPEETPGSDAAPEKPARQKK